MKVAAEKENTSKYVKAFNIFVGLCLIVSGINILPFVFDMLYSFDSIVEKERIILYWFAFCIIFSGVVILFLKNRKINSISLLLFSFLFLLWIELFFRLVLNGFASDQTKTDLYMYSNMTYPEYTAYEGSPFLHFTGKTDLKLKGSQALTGYVPFNNFGFIGQDMFFYKPKNVIRIACLGESTTADGYPEDLQNYLNKYKLDPAFRYEVYNFGQAYWTTAHSATNFLLNIRDFSPDLIVLHHGWNEEKVRNFPDSVFRNDYSHILKSFERPFVFDRYLIRTSGLYRYFKFQYDQTPEWTNLANSVHYSTNHDQLNYDNINQLYPFERNLKSIINLALIENIKVIIATLPHTTNPEAPLYYSVKNIEQCNAISRKIVNDFEYKVTLVDLDSIITGKNNAIFTDLGHVTDEGRKLKSKYIGKAIHDIIENAEYIAGIDTSWKKIYEVDAVQYYLYSMNNSTSWLSDLQRKSADSGLNLDSVMVQDARYMIKNEYPEYVIK